MRFFIVLVCAVALSLAANIQESQAQYYRSGSSFGRGFSYGGYGGFGRSSSSFGRSSSNFGRSFNGYSRSYGGGVYGSYGYRPRPSYSYKSYRPVYGGGSFYGGRNYGRSYGRSVYRGY